MSGSLSASALPSTSDMSLRRTAPATRSDSGCATWPRTSSILDCDMLPIPWMRLHVRTPKRKRCARYRHMRGASAASRARAGILRARAYPVHPVVVSGGPGRLRRCDPLLAPSSPAAGTHIPASSSQPLLPQWHHTSHPRTPQALNLRRHPAIAEPYVPWRRRRYS